MKKRFQEEVYRQAKPAREEPPPLHLKEARREKANPQPDALKKQIEPPPLPLPLKEEGKEMANPQPSALRKEIEREIEEGFEELKEGFEEFKYTVVKARGSITWQVIGLSLLVFIVIMIFITA